MVLVQCCSMGIAARGQTFALIWCNRHPVGESLQCHSRTMSYWMVHGPRGWVSCIPVGVPVKTLQIVLVQSFQHAVVGVCIRGHCSLEWLIVSSPEGMIFFFCSNACGKSIVPMWSAISAKVVTCRCILHALICSSWMTERSKSRIASMMNTSCCRIGGIIHESCRICILCF